MATASHPSGLGPAIRPVSAQSTVDRVDTELRRAFVTGALRPGEEFSMAELSAQLQVSHVPVREALRRLEAEGLIILRRGRSAVVAPVDRGEIEDVYRLWVLICNDIVARACERYTDEDLAAIAASLDAFTALPQDSEEAFDEHQQFHMRLLRPGASAWDLRILRILWLVIERAVRLAYPAIIDLAGERDPGERAYEEHRPLLDAAQSRDAERLQRAVRDHHERHMRLVVAALPAVVGDGSRSSVNTREER